MNIMAATTTNRPNYWTAPWDCPHNEVAFSATETWCETCGSDIDTEGKENGMTEQVYTPGLLGAVERLHQNASRGMPVAIDDVTYDLTFDGHNYVATVAGEHVATFNTRKVTVARKWLREYVVQS